MPLTSNYPRRRLSAIVEGPRPSTPQGSGYGDLRQWAGQVVEKVRVASVGGRLRFLPWFDPYSDETPEMRAEYRHMLRESSVKAAFQTKVLSVISEDIQFQADDDDDPRQQEGVAFCDYAFRKLKGGTRALGWSILGPALIDGHSVCEKVWRPDPLPRGKFAGKRIYHAVKSKDTHFLQLGIDPYRNLTALRGTGFNAGRVWSPSDFIVFSYFPLFENPSGMSDFRAAYRPYWVKDTSWKLRALFLEKFTGPFIVGHYTNQETRAALEEAFDNAKSSTWLTVPAGDVVECLDLAMKGTSDFKDAIADCDREILIAIVGAHLQILEGQTGGARGNTKVHKEIGELIQWWLAATLADVYREQIVVPLMAENYHDVEPPDVSIGAVTDDAILERAKVFEALQKLGVSLSKKAVVKACNVQAPDPDDKDDVLKPPGAAPAASSGGQGPGGPAPPGGPPAGPDQGGGGNGQALSEKEVGRGPAPFGGGSDRWPYGFSEQGWHTFAAANASRKVGEKWQGPSGRWFTKRQDNRIVPTSSPEQDRARQEKGKAKEAAAKAKAAVKAKADAAAKKKAEAEAKRKAAEAAKAKAAAAKEAAAKKAGQQRQQAAQHIRDVVSGSATTTPARVRAAGAHLLNMTATELRALKSEIGAKGGGAAKAGIVQAITERALAARKAGKGKAVPAKPAKPIAKPKPGKQPGASLTAAALIGKLKRDPDTGELLVPLEADEFPPFFMANLPDGRSAGDPKAVNDAARHAPVASVSVEGLIATQTGLDEKSLTHALAGGASDGLPIVIKYGGKNYLSDGTHRTVAAMLRGDKMVRAAVIDLDSPPSEPAGVTAATALPTDQQAALAKRKFTGTDRLGRKWVNGELVAKEEGLTAPDDRQRQIDFISDRLGKARAELERAFPHGPQDSQGYRDRAKQVADYQAQLDALGGGKGPDAVHPADLADAWEKLHTDNLRMGGIVSVPELYDALKEADPSLTPEALGQQLEALAGANQLVLQEDRLGGETHRYVQLGPGQLANLRALRPEAPRARAGGLSPRQAAALPALADAYGAVRDANRATGGIVKIPEVYDAVKELHPDLTLPEFHKMLLHLEDQDRAVLQIVANEDAEPRRGEMVRSGRGLLGYIQMRPDQLEALRNQGQRPTPATTPTADPATTVAEAGKAAAALGGSIGRRFGRAKTLGEQVAALADLDTETFDAFPRGKYGLATNEYFRHLDGAWQQFQKGLKGKRDVDRLAGTVQSAVVNGKKAAAALRAEGQADKADFYETHLPAVAAALVKQATAEVKEPVATPAATPPRPAPAPRETSARHDIATLGTINALDTGNNLVPLTSLRRHLASQGLSRPEQDAAIDRLYRGGQISLVPDDGRHGTTPEQREAQYTHGGERFDHVAIKRR